MTNMRIYKDKMVFNGVFSFFGVVLEFGAVEGYTKMVVESYEPKVDVKAKDSLFLLSYTDLPPLQVVDSGVDKIVVESFNIHVYIDIPLIDYANLNGSSNVKSSFVRNFKLNGLKQMILQSLVNERFTGRATVDTKVNLNVHSSGSLRYVETIKYLIDSLHSSVVENDRIVYNIEVSNISLKWFNSFINKSLLKKINFIHMNDYQNTLDNPFKQYYTLLNTKFVTSKGPMISDDTNCFDSIAIVTDSTGVKALLTILSDRPLFKFITKESIDTLNSMQYENDSTLKRESSSIMSLHNNLLTSNRDRSVRIRSLSINRYSNRANITKTSDLLDYLTSIKDGSIKDTINNDETNNSSDESDNEEILTIDVPNKLSRSNSSLYLSDSSTIKPTTAKRNGRFRSLSLMDQSYSNTFNNIKRNSTFTQLTNFKTLKALPSINSSNDDKDDYTYALMEHEVSNIYIHDGEFEDLLLYSNALIKKHKRRNTLTNNNNPLISNSLIPPEFYSRISSPSTSTNSSDVSLNNMDYAPTNKINNDQTNLNSPLPNTLFERNLINKSFDELKKQPSMTSLFTTLIAGNNDNNVLALNFKSRAKPKDSQALASSFLKKNDNYITLEDEDMMISGSLGTSPSNATITPVNSYEQLIRINTPGYDTYPELASKINDKPLVFPRNLERDTNSKDDDTYGLSTSLKLDLNLDLNLYNSQNNDDYKINSDNHKRSQNNDNDNDNNNSNNKIYKKAISFDLYGDDDTDNTNVWVLGGNFR